jgi:hypothetical protein
LALTWSTPLVFLAPLTTGRLPTNFIATAENKVSIKTRQIILLVNLYWKIANHYRTDFASNPSK